jgi:RNA polymerase-binding transcription factor DksA
MSAGASKKSSQAWVPARLEAEREIARDRMGALKGDLQRLVAASADSNADDEHDPEGSTIAFERSQLLALIAQVQRHLDEIEDAGRRLAAGRFGLCESCGQPIARARLEARPVARTCVDCAPARAG